MDRLSRRVAALAGARRYGLAAALGAATALAQPPVSWPVVLFLALPPLAWLLDGARSWRGALAARLGDRRGALRRGALLDRRSLPRRAGDLRLDGALRARRHGRRAGAVLGAALRAWPAALWPAGLRRLLALAALWALADLARAYVLTGFPWGLPAYAWVETPVIQTVALFGPHMLGLLTLVAALLPARLLLARRAVALALVAAGWGFGAWRLSQPLPPREPAVTVRLVQPERRPGAEVAAGDGAGALRPPPRADRAPSRAPTSPSGRRPRRPSCSTTAPTFSPSPPPRRRRGR